MPPSIAERFVVERAGDHQPPVGAANARQIDPRILGGLLDRALPPRRAPRAPPRRDPLPASAAPVRSRAVPATPRSRTCTRSGRAPHVGPAPPSTARHHHEQLRGFGSRLDDPRSGARTAARRPPPCEGAAQARVRPGSAGARARAGTPHHLVTVAPLQRIAGVEAVERTDEQRRQIGILGRKGEIERQTLAERRGQRCGFGRRSRSRSSSSAVLRADERWFSTFSSRPGTPRRCRPAAPGAPAARSPPLAPPPARRPRIQATAEAASGERRASSNASASRRPAASRASRAKLLIGSGRYVIRGCRRPRALAPARRARCLDRGRSRSDLLDPPRVGEHRVEERQQQARRSPG